jgi:hypothetical protein
MYRVQLYSESFREKYNVALEKTGFSSSNAKWSDRMRDAFLASGQVWNESVERQCKWMVVELVEESPVDALGKQGLGSFGALQDALELKLKLE